MGIMLAPGSVADVGYCQGWGSDSWIVDLTDRNLPETHWEWEVVGDFWAGEVGKGSEEEVGKVWGQK